MTIFVTETIFARWKYNVVVEIVGKNAGKSFFGDKNNARWNISH